MPRATTLISTVGTSFLFPNVAGLSVQDADPRRAFLAKAYQDRNPKVMAKGLAAYEPHERICGAEINSIASLVQGDYVAGDANLLFCHSDTDEGRLIGAVLRDYFVRTGHPTVELIEIVDLNDDFQSFRTRGLRNVAKALCRAIRDNGPATAAVNATGGYKAQIAIAVLMAQAIGVPVYYRHERFAEIISFPSLPTALDYEIWMQHSGMLFDLDRAKESVSSDDYAGDCAHHIVDRVSRFVDRRTRVRACLDFSGRGRVSSATPGRPAHQESTRVPTVFAGSRTRDPGSRTAAQGRNISA